MSDGFSLGAALLAFVAAAASPGPATLALAQVSMAHGRAEGLRFGLGLTLGLAVWGMLAGAGAWPLVARSVWLLFTLKLVGGLYLLWLAFAASRSALRPEADGGLVLLPGNAAFRSGLLLNLANPKAVFAWVAVIALGLPPGAEPGAVPVTVAACSVLGLGVYGLYALIFSVQPARRVYRRARRAIDAVAALVFAGFGARLFATRIPAAP